MDDFSSILSTDAPSRQSRIPLSPFPHLNCRMTKEGPCIPNYPTPQLPVSFAQWQQTRIHSVGRKTVQASTAQELLNQAHRKFSHRFADLAPWFTRSGEILEYPQRRKGRSGLLRGLPFTSWLEQPTESFPQEYA